ncbi:hypothetical protein NliqN6_3690 [Naganishia liquefaciens]|uniref:Uncharacterized protein n=1 Tax=Naganishia liquefaciens TaxID=104408 RepID=A0A8H3TUT2_9TREE|nr:hypothetical protein NliqN6_3690 [Naganishia liquefaciens]
MPVFSVNVHDDLQWRHSHYWWQSLRNEQAGRWQAFDSRADVAIDYQVRQSRPLRNAPSSVSPAFRHSPTSATRVLGDHAFLNPIPSYKTIQSRSHANSDGDVDPPAYDPKWDMLPTYRAARNARRESEGGRFLGIGATPPSHWMGSGAPQEALPIAAATDEIFFNSPFQHYRLTPDGDMEGGSSRTSDTICGIPRRRASLIINVSLLALCIIIWSAVVLSLDFSEPRLSEPSSAVTSSGSGYASYVDAFFDLLARQDEIQD